jgi:hypothetical protein
MRAAVLFLIPTLLAAQTALKSSVPRTADGKPDLTGVWQGGSTQRGSWEEANSGTGVGGTGKDPNAPVAPASVANVPGRELPPYQPWAAKKVLDSFNKRGIDDPNALCLPPGVPRTALVGLFPLEIIQTPQKIVILHEYMAVFRLISLNTKHPEDLEPTYMGDSVGHWEGDTLVVDKNNFTDTSWIYAEGRVSFHSDAMHVVERYRRVDANTLEIEAKVEDPKVLSKPWDVPKQTLVLAPFDQIMELACSNETQSLMEGASKTAKK